MGASGCGRNGSRGGFRGGGRGSCLGYVEGLGGHRGWEGADGLNLPPHGECEDECDGGDDERTFDCTL